MGTYFCKILNGGGGATNLGWGGGDVPPFRLIVFLLNVILRKSILSEIQTGYNFNFLQNVSTSNKIICRED